VAKVTWHFVQVRTIDLCGHVVCVVRLWLK
jgi:hypothetical protein